MFGLPKEIAGAIIAAVIAAVISLLGLIISKENKVSEFRQAWIDALRAEVAAVITHGHAIFQAFDAVVGEPKGLEWKEIREDFVALEEQAARIRLRLNPTEKPSIALMEVLGEFHSLFRNFSVTPDPDKVDSVSKRLLKVTQPVLKSEWRRVKRGELVYKGATILAGLLVIGGLFLLFKPSVLTRWNKNQYRVVERTDTYVDKQGRAVPDDSYDHEIVHFVLAHDERKIYGLCDLSTLDKLDPHASCGLRPLRSYECLMGRTDVMKAPTPLSDLTCTDGDGRKVYLYVSKEE